MTFLDAWVQGISGLTASAIGLMALTGLIVGLAPSSYPLLAVGAGFATGTTVEGPATRSRAVLLASGFVLGIALIDAAVGALFGLLGFAVLRVLAGLMIPVYFALSLLLLLMALALLRVITIDLRILYATPKPVGGFWRAVVLGVPFGLSTCPACTPLILPVMLAAAASADAMMGAVLLFIFGIARGIPIIAVGAAADLLPRMLPASLWMRRIERAAGILLLLASAAFGYQAAVYAGWVPPVPI